MDPFYQLLLISVSVHTYVVLYIVPTRTQLLQKKSLKCTKMQVLVAALNCLDF